MIKTICTALSFLLKISPSMCRSRLIGYSQGWPCSLNEYMCALSSEAIRNGPFPSVKPQHDEHNHITYSKNKVFPFFPPSSVFLGNIVYHAALPRPTPTFPCSAVLNEGARSAGLARTFSPSLLPSEGSRPFITLTPCSLTSDEITT